MVEITRPQRQGADRQPIASTGIGSQASAINHVDRQFQQRENMKNVVVEYRRRLKVQEEENELNSVMSSATKDLTAQNVELLTKGTNEDGSPAYLTLMEDSESIGSSILAKHASNMKNEGAKNRFESKFNEVLFNNQLSNFTEFRKKHSDFSIASLNENIENYSQRALSDSPQASEGYISDIAETILTARESGTISAVEAQKRLQDSTDNIRKGTWVRNIGIDPVGSSAKLENLTPEQMGVSFKAAEQIKNISAAKIDDLNKEETRRIAKQEDAFKKNQALNARRLSVGITTGTAASADVETAFLNNEITETEKLNLTEKLFRAREVVEIKDQSISAISRDLSLGLGMYSHKATDVNDHYNETISEMIDTGDDVTLLQKADLAQNYNLPIESFTNEIGAVIQFGDNAQVDEAIQAYQSLIQESPAVLSKLSDDQKNLFATVLSTTRNTNLPLGEAVKRARERQENITSDLRKTFNANFLKEAKFKPEAIVETVKEAFQGTSLLPFNDGATVDLNVVDDLYPLYRAAYIDLGDANAAIERVKVEVGNKYGLSELSGQGDTVVFMPIENTYKGVTTQEIGAILGNNLLSTDVNINLPKGADVVLEGDKESVGKPNPRWFVKYRDDRIGGNVPVIDKNTGLPMTFNLSNEDINGVLDSRKEDAKIKREEEIKKGANPFDFK